jgi:disulfide bond formation protein DsbB
MDSLGKARLLAVLVPAALLGGAYVSQYGFGLPPCEMCWWQRYPHFAALGLGLLAFFMPPARLWTALAGLAIITSGAIGGFHAGVEYHWWRSPRIGSRNCSEGADDGQARTPPHDPGRSGRRIRRDPHL